MAQAPNARWFINRFKQSLDPPQTYENSLYGPLNVIFMDIFPPSREFLVSPQALLQEVVGPTPMNVVAQLPPSASHHQSAHHAVPVSSAPAASSAAPEPSYDDLDLPQGEVLLKNWIPDFVISKGSEAMGMTFDLTLTLIEVKRHDKQRETYVQQVLSYLNALQIGECSDRFIAYLIMSTDTLVWQSEARGANQTHVQESATIATGGEAFLYRLKALH
ncbi:hypothetical protein SCP_0200820 [Sparassis crispa]|uniref:Fungal-type protein kinase domain-containing protein n=1 Tax=Sparassis crispa TaxID=139825 RepID=A0A401G9P1_9APHY|nr:hypothetical protein SCP_0200820 [Sparassis crispa]GBE78885.1 hypothetical protein SCP_0200820 [Sparassis crispa]